MSDIATQRLREHRRRALAFVKALDVRASARVEELEFGTALFREELPHVRSRNFVWVDAASALLDIPEVVRTAERLHREAGLPHRRLIFEDETTAEEAAALLRPRGWRAERQVVMSHDGSSQQEPRASEAREVGAEALLPAREILLRSFPEIRSEASVQQLLAADAALTAGTRERCFAWMDGDEIVSFCHLFSDGKVAQIEDVETVPVFRRRGHARAVVCRAVAEAVGHDLTFLLALDEDWPKHWYARIGFREIGYLWELVLIPDERDTSAGPLT